MKIDTATAQQFQFQGQEFSPPPMPTNFSGPTSPNGLQGPQGPQGPKGPNGPTTAFLYPPYAPLSANYYRNGNINTRHFYAIPRPLPPVEIPRTYKGQEQEQSNREKRMGYARERRRNMSGIFDKLDAILAKQHGGHRGASRMKILESCIIVLENHNSDGLLN